MIDNELLNIRTQIISLTKNVELLMKHYFHTNKYSIIDQNVFMLVSKQGQNLPIHACGYLWHQKYNIVNKNHTRCVFHLLPIVYYKIFLGLHSTILHRKYWVQNVHRTCPGFLSIHITRTLFINYCNLH